MRIDKKVVDLCEKGRKYFRDNLLKHESLDKDALFYYLSVDMINIDPVKFKECMKHKNIVKQ